MSNVNARGRRSGVQSVFRALDLLDTLEREGGTLGISELADLVGLPAGTVHRLATTLVDSGYLRHLSDRRYCLGSRLASLGASATALMGTQAQPVLRDLAGALGETANLAVFSSGDAEYVGQVAGSHSMRMFTEVGRRVPVHSTGVGKALLSMLADHEALRVLRREGMPSFTSSTITTPELMVKELAHIREQGYAVDDGEMEVGVRCVAVPFHAGSLMAVSVSGPSLRMTPDLVIRAADALKHAAVRLSGSLDDRPERPTAGDARM